METKNGKPMLKTIATNIWIYDGDVVPFYGFPYTTRMTVIRLSNNSLWIHSPEKLNPALQKELETLGKVSFLISPNKLHHLFLEEWISAYPEAKTYAAPGLIEKRKDIDFTKELSDLAESEWGNEIGQHMFIGSSVMKEVVFFHIQSKTLILTDLIENFNENHFSGWKKIVAKLTGILSPNGKTPLDWRMSFIFGKSKARKSLDTIISWKPENIILSHGECVFGGGLKFLKKSFSWLL